MNAQKWLKQAQEGATGKMMKTDQMGAEEGRGKVSGIFHLSTGG